MSIPCASPSLSHRPSSLLSSPTPRVRVRVSRLRRASSVSIGGGLYKYKSNLVHFPTNSSSHVSLFTFSSFLLFYNGNYYCYIFLFFPCNCSSHVICICLGIFYTIQCKLIAYLVLCRYTSNGLIIICEVVKLGCLPEHAGWILLLDSCS